MSNKTSQMFPSNNKLTFNENCLGFFFESCTSYLHFTLHSVKNKFWLQTAETILGDNQTGQFSGSKRTNLFVISIYRC